MVENRRGHQRLVRNDRLDPIEAANDHVARGDLAHDPEAIVDRDHVADADGTVEQYGETGDVVAGELLQSEPDPYAERPAENRKHRQVDAYEGKRDQDADQDQNGAEDLRQHHPQIVVEVRQPHHALLDQARHPERQYQHDDDDQCVASEVEYADLGLAYGHACFFERRSDVRQNADVIEQQGAPDREADRALGRQHGGV